ncbi:Crp/Fnr family transcriptional regulator [Streptomonospora sp. S1-112]|uniref:Crp/Fnr family transcriptional regulator n=1 Tax=Streptomonospora mangrovi TaxID=2883123 RepID=A0A9X3SEJ6_9ACTN|nr:Crp/Fnr family transcriptional regulator [Streptomonospora mangrovi]MDA0563850.1 Crp/Fnr family transcriptional regulator [Streptomonospora mangrovi]
MGRQGFGGRLTDAQWSTFLREGATRGYGDGQTIVRQGDRDTAVFLLVEGTVKVTALRPDGEHVLLALRGPGEALGEFSALSGLPRTATVTASGGGCLTRTLSSARFRHVARRLGVEDALWQHAVLRQTESESMRAEIMTLPSAQRLSAMLLRLCALIGHEVDAAPDQDAGRRAVTLRLGLSQRELGYSVGLSRTSVAAEFARLRALGVVRTGRRYVAVLDVERLRKLAEGAE